MEFGKILKKLRLEKNVTQLQLAQQLNLTDTAVRLWETKGQEPSYTTLCKLADIFDVSLDELLGRKEY